MFGEPIDYIVDWKNKSDKLSISFSIRSSKNSMGRFGGGWQWKLGFQASRHTVIFSLLIAELRISWYGLVRGGVKS